MSHRSLPRRERQILDIVYRLGRASAQEVQERLPDVPSYSAVRVALRGMEEKGLLAHKTQDGRYVYAPTVPKRRAGNSAMRYLVQTFFDGSASDAVAALLKTSSPTQEELERLEALIAKAKKEGR